MNFELIDNFFQVFVLGVCALVAGFQAFRKKDRCLLTLSFAYACFSMGTLYYVLYIAIIGTVPQKFYVAEISWLASYLFYLSMQILRTEKLRIRFSLVPAICAFLAAAVIFIVKIFGPSYVMIGLFALTGGAIVYLCTYRLQIEEISHRIDWGILHCMVLQVLVYVVSSFISDYTRFNVYFAVDLALTGFFVELLPLTLQEVRAK